MLESWLVKMVRAPPAGERGAEGEGLTDDSEPPFIFPSPALPHAWERGLSVRPLRR